MHSVMNSQAAGKQPVAGCNLNDIVPVNACHTQRSGKHFGPHVDAFPCMSHNNWFSGCTGRSVKPDDFNTSFIYKHKRFNYFSTRIRASTAKMRLPFPSNGFKSNSLISTANRNIEDRRTMISANLSLSTPSIPR